MQIEFLIPSGSYIEANCVKVSKPIHLRDGTLGSYRDAKCKHCALGKCPGHVGYIKLPFNIMNPVYYYLIPKIMSCICVRCSTPVMPKSQTTSFSDYVSFVRSGKFVECTEGCPGETYEYDFIQKFDDKECEFTKNDKDNGDGFFVKPKKKDFMLSIDNVKRVFKQISNYDYYRMGFYNNFRAEDLITDCVMVLPNNARNNLCMDGVADEYTVLYEYILNAGKDKYVEVMNKTIELVGKRPDAENLPMIRHILTSKEGLMRSNLMCSRQNRSARSVISTDSYIPLSHVGVPKIFKDKLAVYVHMKDLSSQAMLDLIQSDECVTMGNLPINKEKVTLKKLEKYRQNDKYYIERALRNDDWVFINRQPTLHRHSIIAFKAQLVDCRTIVMNLACVTAFNADFDGDEVTLYVASDKDSIRDCEKYLAVEHNIVSPEDGKLVIVPVQDCITGTYIMSQSDEPMPQPLVNKLHEILDEYVSTPKEAIGTLCTFEKPIDKTVLCNLIKQMKGKDAINFMTKLQKVVDIYFKVYPLSMRYTDFNPLSLDEINNVLDKFYVSHNSIIENAENNKKLYPFYAQQIEARICNYLETTVKERMLKSVLKNAKDSDLLCIIRSKAKGRELDLVQSWLALCQQYVSGRQEEMYGLKPDALVAERYGFVTTSYGRGLDEAGMYYQAVAARSSIINTGVNTADPGYLQRQLSKLMADVVATEEGTIVNHEGVVIGRF